jgi:hypothetical protein
VPLSSGVRHLKLEEGECAMQVKQVARWVLTAVLIVLLGVIAVEISILIRLHRYNKEPLSKIVIPDNTQEFAQALAEGKDEAIRDLSQGKLIIKVTGMQMQGEARNHRRIYRRYRIRMNRVAGCIVTNEVDGNVRGYNEVMEKAIEEKYGKGFLDKSIY